MSIRLWSQLSARIQKQLVRWRRPQLRSESHDRKRGAHPPCRELYHVSSLHQPRRPADADKKTVRSAYAHLVKTPFAVPQDPTRTDNQIVHPRSDSVNIGRANENTKRIVRFRNPPRAIARLRQMHLAIPTSHDDIIGITAG